MKFSVRPGRLCAWIAIFAILLAALAPSLAQALSSSPQQATEPWAEVCTAGGMQSVHAGAPASGSGRHEGGNFKHCPFCLNHAGHLVLPAAPFNCLPAADAGAESFSSPATTPSPRFIRAAAQPRAPPINS